MDRLTYWQQRARDAERLKAYTEAEMERQREWMQHCFDEERRLRDRCTFLYGEAMARGATHEELRQP
jgi:hypothetical protein